MRLTLRTLLAYLDDILEPADARDMGAKIAESPRAAELVRRIRDVMRRRRLMAPDLEGPGAGIDPNVVAEYLDNTLTPEQVADVERICLESDVHLAEVAACHQVLTLVLGEPVEIVSQSRERMYALGPVAASSAVGALSTPEGEAATKTNGTTKEAAAAPKAAAAVPFSERIPDYLKPRPLWKRALPYAAVLVLLAAFVGLLATDPAFSPFSPVPATVSDADAAADSVADETQLEPAAPVQKAEPEQNLVAAAPNQPAPEGAGGAVRAERVNLDPPPPADEPEAATVVDARPPLPEAQPMPPMAEPPPAAAETEVAVAEMRPQPAPAAAVENPPVPAAQPPKPVPVGPPVEYNSVEGVFLRYDEADAAWFVLPRRSLVHVGERVASPEPFDAVLNIGRDDLTATLLGGTAAQLVPPGDGADFGIAIEQGRLVVERKPAAAGNGKGRVLTVSVGDQTWRLELLSDDARFGIEIAPRQPEAFEQDLGEDTFSGGLYVASGAVGFTDEAGQTIEIHGRDWLSLRPSDRAAARAGALPHAPLLTVPTWLESTAKTSSQRRFGTLFEKEFEVKQPMILSVTPMIKDPVPQLSELAVKCFATTWNSRALAKSLAQAPHEEARLAAIAGLRAWLPRDPENGAALKEELKNVFQPDVAVLVYQLLWGYSEADARDPNISAQLVDWLDHGHVAVRELAFFHVHRLTQRRYDYRAQLPPAQRGVAINRWRLHLEREGALLPMP